MDRFKNISLFCSGELRDFIEELLHDRIEDQIVISKLLIAINQINVYKEL